MDAMIFATCIRASVAIATCRTIIRIVRSWLPQLVATALIALGGCAKRADYIAVASSLSPPVRTLCVRQGAGTRASE
ncbi:MAG: hypothetical protein ACREHG_06980 [Candidatus Saccharimonadales bacterium]